MKLKFLFLALFFAISNIGEAETVSLPWKEIAMDDGIILQFSNMHENAIIKTLREKYQIKVLILDTTSSIYASVNPNLTIGNLKEDQNAVRYYTLDNKEVAESEYGGYIGEFFEPFSHRNHLDKIARPYLEHPLIVLTLDASRMAIIHEFLHFYIYSLEKAKGKIEAGGIPHARQCGKERLLEREKAGLNQEIFQKMMRDDLSLDWVGNTKSKEDIDGAIIILNYIKNNFDYLIGGVKEELDIYYLSLKYKKELYLPEKEITHISNSISNYIHWIHNRIMDILPTRLLKGGSFCTHPGEEALKARYKDLESFRKNIEDKCVFSSEHR